MKKSQKTPEDLCFSNNHPAPSPQRPQTQGLSHTLRYSKAFFSLIQQTSSTAKPTLDETEYKSFFNKTNTSTFHPQKTTKNQTQSSFNQTKASFHSNLFITTKNQLFSPKESLVYERPSIKNFDAPKPLTSMNKHRYQRSSFLNDKILTENFFLPFEATKPKSTLDELPSNKKMIHSVSLSYLTKAVQTPSLIKVQPPKVEMKPEDFQCFKKKVVMDKSQEEKYRKPKIGGNSFKIKTMLLTPQAQDIKLSVKETIEKRLIRIPKEKYIGQNYKVKKTILVIEDSLLDQINHKTNLKYCYLDIPSFEDHTFERLKTCSEILMQEISNKFNINARALYLYLKSGNPVNDFIEMPEHEYTLIVSPRTSFVGFTNKRSPVFYKFFKTLKIINELEIPLKIFNESKGRSTFSQDKTYEIKIREKYKDLIKDTVKLIQGEYVDENQKANRMRYKTTQEYFDEKNLQETIYETQKLKELDKIDNMYEQNLKKIKFEAQEVTDSSDEDYQKVKRRTSQSTALLAIENYQEKTAKVAKKLDDIMNKWLKKASKMEKKGEDNNNNDKSNESEEVDENLFEEDKTNGKDFEDINKNKFRTKKRMLELLHKENRELFLQNIPKLMNKTNFTRSEIHTTYILFKVLQQITSQRYENYSIEEGLDYETFRNGIPQIFHQAEAIAKKIFYTIDYNYSGFLNWEEFLNLMEIIKAKTLREKIDLFIKIADDDGNGQLSKKEIFELCKICLEKYIKTNDENDQFLDDISNYFTRLIFAAVEIDIEEEIPLEKIKETILSGNVESDLLCMFCGADI